jgi:hypothetical protein
MRLTRLRLSDAGGVGIFETDDARALRALGHNCAPDFPECGQTEGSPANVSIKGRPARPSGAFGEEALDPFGVTLSCRVTAALDSRLHRGAHDQKSCSSRNLGGLARTEKRPTIRSTPQGEEIKRS